MIRPSRPLSSHFLCLSRTHTPITSMTTDHRLIRHPRSNTHTRAHILQFDELLLLLLLLFCRSLSYLNSWSVVIIMFFFVSLANSSINSPDVQTCTVNVYTKTIELIAIAAATRAKGRAMNSKRSTKTSVEM